MDGSPIGGTEIKDQWICLGLKIPVNGTYQVKLRIAAEAVAVSQGLAIFFDDIRFVQS